MRMMHGYKLPQVLETVHSDLKLDFTDTVLFL